MVRLTRFISLPLLLHVHVRCATVSEWVCGGVRDTRDTRIVVCDVCVDHIHVVFSTFVSTEYIIIFIPCVSVTRLFVVFPFSIFTVSNGERFESHMIAWVCVCAYLDVWLLVGWSALHCRHQIRKLVNCSKGEIPGKRMSDGLSPKITIANWQPKTQKTEHAKRDYGRCVNVKAIWIRNDLNGVHEADRVRHRRPQQIENRVKVRIDDSVLSVDSTYCRFDWMNNRRTYSRIRQMPFSFCCLFTSIFCSLCTGNAYNRISRYELDRRCFNSLVLFIVASIAKSRDGKNWWFFFWFSAELRVVLVRLIDGPPMRHMCNCECLCATIAEVSKVTVYRAY